MSYDPFTKFPALHLEKNENISCEFDKYDVASHCTNHTYPCYPVYYAPRSMRIFVILYRSLLYC